MSITGLFHKLRNGLHPFRTARDGNVLITFALTLIPVIAAVGAAVDYSRASSDKAAMWLCDEQLLFVE